MRTLDLKYTDYLTHLNDGLCSLLATASNVDVTLAVDGLFIKAHQNILSIFSPYFEELFRSNPCQHPIFFMKDVTYLAMKSLITFMYEGKVQIQEEHVPDFIAIAKALRIRGLTNIPDLNEMNLQSSVEIPSNSQQNADKLEIHLAADDKVRTYGAKESRTATLSAQLASSILENVIETTHAEQSPSFDSVNIIDKPIYSIKIERNDGLIEHNINDTDPFQCTSQEDKLEIDYNADNFDCKIEVDEEVILCLQDEEVNPLDVQEAMDEQQDSAYDLPGISSTVDNIDNMTTKSKARYEHQYQCFWKWKLTKNLQKTTENVMFSYIYERSTVQNPSTLWTEFSMLKTMLKLKEKTDIGKYNKVVVFLRQNAKGYNPKKSKVLSDLDCKQFLKDAPDEIYLMMKVALVMGIHGACSRTDLTNIVLDDIKIKDDCFLVSMSREKHYLPRTFVITNEANGGVDMVQLLNQYLSLRPSHTPHNRFFIQYKRGKCTTNPVGVNTFSQIPSKIASYLKLDDPKLYTGHCFRRSSALCLASSGK